MTGNPQGKLMLANVEPFQQHGLSGAWVSSFMPHTAEIVDDLCFIKSLHTDAVNHAPAISFLLSAGCRFAQGSYFSRPVPADEASALLQAGSISRPTAAKPADSVRLLVG